MTRPKPQLTDQEYRARILRLKQLDISMGATADPSPEPDRLILEQIEPAYARLYQLPSGDVLVVVLARMTVVTPGMLITQLEMTTSLDDFPLDLSRPQGWECYNDVIDQLPSLPPVILNDLLKRGLPLGLRQVEGVILAKGPSTVPPQCHDETLLTAELILEDERRNEISTTFEVRLDRSLIHKHETRLRIRGERLPATGRGGGLYGPHTGPPGHQKSPAPEKAINPRHTDAGYRKPN